jgi:hypothetical protein
MPYPVFNETYRQTTPLTERTRTDRRCSTAAGRTLVWETAPEASPPRRRRGEIFAVAKPPLCWR